jgi:hypothetical protein
VFLVIMFILGFHTIPWSFEKPKSDSFRDHRENSDHSPNNQQQENPQEERVVHETRIIAQVGDVPYITANGTHVVFTRPVVEPGRQYKTTTSIQLKCACPITSDTIRPPFCANGIECELTFDKLRYFRNLRSALRHPFGSTMIWSRSSMAAGSAVPYMDCWGDRITSYVAPLFLESLSQQSLAPPVGRSYLHERCAVVGQSSILGNASYGGQIDTYDAVFRMNENPVEDAPEDLGSRASYWILSGQYTSFEKLRATGIPDRIKRLGAKLIWVYNQESDVKRIISFHRNMPDVDVYALHPAFWQWWIAHRRDFLYPDTDPDTWEEFFTATRPSAMSGTIATLEALQLCRVVHMYGFYGWIHSPDGRELAFHYSNAEARDGLSVRVEFELFLQLARLSDSEQELKVIL